MCAGPFRSWWIGHVPQCIACTLFCIQTNGFEVRTLSAYLFVYVLTAYEEILLEILDKYSYLHDVVNVFGHWCSLSFFFKISWSLWNNIAALRSSLQAAGENKKKYLFIYIYLLFIIKLNIDTRKILVFLRRILSKTNEFVLSIHVKYYVINAEIFSVCRTNITVYNEECKFRESIAVRSII